QPRRHRRRDLFPQRRRPADADPQGPAAAGPAPLQGDAEVGMPPLQRRAARSAVAAALLVAASSLAAAQESYPGKPIRLIAPEVPGSATDILARIIAAKLADGFGQPVTVSNNFGEAGLIEGIKSPPDGYTLVYGSAGTLALLPHIKKVAFD